MGFVPSSLPGFPREESRFAWLVFRPWTSLGFPSFPDSFFLRFHGTLASSSRGSSRFGSTTSWAFVGSSRSFLAGCGLLSSSLSAFLLPLHGSASTPGFGTFHGGARRRDPASSCRWGCRRRASEVSVLLLRGDAVRCRRVGLLIGVEVGI